MNIKTMRRGLVQRVTTETTTQNGVLRGNTKYILIMHQSGRNQGKNTTPVLFRGLLLKRV